MIQINAYNARFVMDRTTGQLYEWDADAQTWNAVGDPGPTIKAWPLADVLAEGPDGGGIVVENIGDPLNLQDAATKAYVDAQIATLFTLFSSVHGSSVVEFPFESAGAGEGDGVSGYTDFIEFTWLTDAAGTA